MSNLSICIITKNECEHLKICLERIKKYNLEIVVIDTGSTDASKKIASNYTKNVYDFIWCDDFAAARNFAISKASNEFILFLDSDEYVDEIDIDKLLSIIHNNSKSKGYIYIKSTYENDGQTMSSTEPIARIFSKLYYHFEGRIHEQLVPNNNSIIPKTYNAPVYVTHVGYEGDTTYKKEKAQRNLKLLLKELEHNANDSYILYQIGNSYYFSQQYDNAISYFEKAMELPLDLSLSYVHSIVNLYGYCLINTNQFEKALMLEAMYDDFNKDADFLFVLGLIYMHNAQFENAIQSFLTATTLPTCVVEGVNSYSAYYNVGVILECLGDIENAITYYNKCDNYAPALEGLSRCKNI